MTDSIPEEEYAYPFLQAPVPNEHPLSVKPGESHPFLVADELFDRGSSYAYNLQVPQKAMMGYARSNDGSPVSFVCVMLYKAMMKLYPDMDKDIVFSILHEYRKALGRPLSHDCLARVFPIKLGAKYKDRSVELLNMALRGQIVLGSDESADIDAINGMLQLDAYMRSLPLEGKKTGHARFGRRIPGEEHVRRQLYRKHRLGQHGEIHPRRSSVRG